MSTICEACGRLLRDPSTGRWLVATVPRASIVAAAGIQVAHQCPCGLVTLAPPEWATSLRDTDTPVGTCGICGRKLALRDLTTRPRSDDGLAVHVLGFGLACTEHRGVVEFWETVQRV